MEKRSSDRIKDQAKYTIDEEALKKQAMLHVAYLESDFGNKMSKFPNEKFNLMKLDENEQINSSSNKRRQPKTIMKKDSFRLRVRRNFPALIEQAKQETNNEKISYFAIIAPPSMYPKRNFCSVCGFPSHYKCVMCLASYCSTACNETHQSTRCNKWVV